MNYYNEHDPYAAAWLRELIKARLIPDGLVDERDIQLVQPGDLRDFTQCHFFAGIGGWSYALQLAGWPEDEPVWTGSCPCQPFSSAGKQLGTADKRHLWPEFKRLIEACHPPICFGEQVAKKAGLLWLDGVRTDLESLGYEVGAADIAAASVGAPHIRQRIYWMAKSNRSENHTTKPGQCVLGERCDFVAGNRTTVQGIGEMEAVNLANPKTSQRWRTNGTNVEGRWIAEIGRSSVVGELGHPNHAGPQGRNGKELPECSGEQVAGEGSASDELANAGQRERDSWRPKSEPIQEVSCVWKSDSKNNQRCGKDGAASCWDDFDIAHCRDGKSRRIESGTFPLAHGVPARVVRLRGYGNAIVPQVAAEFIQAAAEALTNL